MTVHLKRSVHVAGFIEEYANRVGLNVVNDGVETVVGDLIADLLHSVASQVPDEQAAPLDAARSGIMHFVSANAVSLEAYEMGDIGPDTNVSIKVSCGTEVWSSFSGSKGTVDDLSLEMEF